MFMKNEIETNSTSTLIPAYNADAVTLQDCIDNYDKKGFIVILENGVCSGFKPDND